MPIRLLHAWHSVRDSLWFVPALMACGAIALAVLTLQLDQAATRDWLSTNGWIHSRSAAGARDLLRVVAGSMITIAGITFSIIVVALQLASSQLGPRLLRNFMRDLGNQVVLGTFIGTFVYCLLVMRTIGLAEDAEPTARLSVVVALALALLSLAVLIYFIHHAASSMQASNVVVAVFRDLLDTIDRLYPEPIGSEAGDAPLPEPPTVQQGVALRTHRTGYLQRVDERRLMRLACEHDALLTLHVRPGAFVVEGETLASIYPGDVAIARRLERTITAACIVGGQRTPEQDVEFVIERLVEVGLRALSPSRQDVFTAVACVEYLSAALVRAAGRHIPSPLRTDSDGRLRVVAPAVTMPLLVSCAFDRLAHAAADAPDVLAALQTARRRVAAATV